MHVARGGPGAKVFLRYANSPKVFSHERFPLYGLLSVGVLHAVNCVGVSLYAN